MQIPWGRLTLIEYLAAHQCIVPNKFLEWFIVRFLLIVVDQFSCSSTLPRRYLSYSNAQEWKDGKNSDGTQTAQFSMLCKLQLPDCSLTFFFPSLKAGRHTTKSCCISLESQGTEDHVSQTWSRSCLTRWIWEPSIQRNPSKRTFCPRMDSRRYVGVFWDAFVPRGSGIQLCTNRLKGCIVGSFIFEWIWVLNHTCTCEHRYVLTSFWFTYMCAHTSCADFSSGGARVRDRYRFDRLRVGANHPD